MGSGRVPLIGLMVNGGEEKQHRVTMLVPKIASYFPAFLRVGATMSPTFCCMLDGMEDQGKRILNEML